MSWSVRVVEFRRRRCGVDVELETSTTFVPPSSVSSLGTAAVCRDGNSPREEQQLAVFVHQISPREPFTVILTVDSNERR